MVHLPCQEPEVNDAGAPGPWATGRRRTGGSDRSDLGFRQGRVGDLALDVDLDDPVDDVVARLRQFGACLARNVVEALNEEALLIAQGDAWQENEARVESGAAAQGPEVTVVLGDECPVLVHANLKYGVVG